MKRRILSILFCSIALAGSSIAQSAYKPAIEHESLMTMRFYEATGGFLVEGLEVVFPPATVRSAALEISRAAGGVVSTVPLRVEPLAGFPAFAMLRPAIGNPGTVKIAQAGDYVMSVKFDGQTVTNMPFSLKQDVSADPFAPGSKWVREGPWRDLAFFSALPNDPSAQIYFNYWLSTRELPAGVKAPKVTIHLMSNGKEVAASRGPVVPDTLDWYFYERKEMIMETQPKQKWLTVGDVAKLNGEIVIVVKANGTPVKTYKTRVQGGEIQKLDRSRLGYEPSTDFISPRYVDTTDRSRSDFTMRDMYWMKKQ